VPGQPLGEHPRHDVCGFGVGFQLVGAGDFPLGRQPEGEHGLLVVLGVPVDPSADLRHPQADAVVLEQRAISAYWLP
jgi:hypothetical protein